MIKIGDTLYKPDETVQSRSRSQYSSKVDRGAWIEFRRMLEKELKGVQIPNKLVSELQDRFNRPNHILFYDSKEDLVQSWRDQGWLVDKTKHAAGLGPTAAMGGRPGFNAEAKAVPINPGENRRHVISASTLGRAVEKSSGDLTSINGFLNRWGQSPATNTLTAKAQVWAVVNSNPHNLWPGEGANNQVAGFIRAPLKLTRDELTKKPDAEVTPAVIEKLKADLAKAHPFMSSSIDGHAEASGKQRWQEAADFCHGAIDSLVDDARQAQNLSDDQWPKISQRELASLVLDLEINADLDIPDLKEVSRQGTGLTERERVHMTGPYFEELCSVYDRTRQVADSDKGAAVEDLFAENGVMDRYMKLNLREMRQISPADLQVTPDDFDHTYDLSDDEDMGLTMEQDEAAFDYDTDVDDDMRVDTDPPNKQSNKRKNRPFDNSEDDPDLKHQRLHEEDGAGSQRQPQDRVVIDLTLDDDEDTAMAVDTDAAPAPKAGSLRGDFYADKNRSKTSRTYGEGSTGHEARIKPSTNTSDTSGLKV